MNFHWFDIVRFFKFVGLYISKVIVVSCTGLSKSAYTSLFTPSYQQSIRKRKVVKNKSNFMRSFINK